MEHQPEGSVGFSDLKVGYATDDQYESPGDDCTPDGGQRQKRRRAFLIQHHRVQESIGEEAGVEDAVRRAGRFPDFGDMSPNHSISSVEGVPTNRYRMSWPSHGQEDQAERGGERVVSVGVGGYRVDVDTDMMNMVQQRQRVAKSSPQQPRRRQHQTPKTRPRRSRLGHVPAARGGPETPSVQSLISNIPAPSPSDAGRNRMRTPSSLAKQADALDARMQYLASSGGRLLSTLKLTVLHTVMEQGKMKSLCHCEDSLGVFHGSQIIVISSFVPGLVQNEPIVVNKPWLVLDDDNVPIMICVGHIQPIKR